MAKTHHSNALTELHFVPLLEKTIQKWVSTSTIINGFKATGLCPWNVNAVDYSKCLRKNTIINKNRAASHKEK